nr:SDR family NAD(P)-dependent oxidoreductase [Hyalangium gracile]
MNVSSGTTLKPLPMLAVYTASKAALNAFTESLALELQPFNVRVSLVMEPFTRSLDVAEVIWRAVNDSSSPIRQPAGADAVALARSN